MLGPREEPPLPLGAQTEEVVPSSPRQTARTNLDSPRTGVSPRASVRSGPLRPVLSKMSRKVLDFGTSPSKPSDVSKAEAAPERFTRLVTTSLVYAASVLEKAEETSLPAVYLFVGRSLNVSPSQLGSITFARAVMQAVMSPVSGILGEKFDRTWVIAGGCCIWAFMTVGIGLSQSMSQAIFFSAFNGVGLSLVIPSCQSMIADYYSAKNRGKAFGLLFALGNIGGTAGTLLATNIGGREIMGMEGWRIFYLILFLMSMICGGVVFVCATDPRGTLQPAKGSSTNLWAEAMMIFRLRTFQVIILQGIVGSMPWYCLGYLTLYFQLLGFSNLQTSLLIAILTLSVAAGNLLGGWLGDLASRWSPNHGRVYVAQVSVFSGIPICYFLLRILPFMYGVSFPAYAFTLCTCGLLISWSAPACNNPVFADIVPEHLRSMIYAYDRCLEGGIGATITPIVGILAEQAFHYRKPSPGDVLTATEAMANAEALSNALVVTLILPWMACLVFYTLLHCSYPHDRDKITMGNYKRVVSSDHDLCDDESRGV